MNSEVNLNEPFGYTIFQTVVKYNLTNNLEIGSWDGEGSTRCFVEAMKLLRAEQLVCLEVDTDKHRVLSERYQSTSFVHPIRESSVGWNQIKALNFDEIWNSPYNRIDKQGCAMETARGWFEIDVEMTKQRVGFLDNYVHQFWDGVLIDGAEFFGYTEFQLLKDSTNVFFLDDAYKAYKCTQARIELESDPDWKLIASGENVRNGFAVFVRKNLL